MSFWYPHDTSVIGDALAGGINFGDDASANFAEAMGYMADNNQAVEDYLANQAIALVTGVCDGSGIAVIAHGITTAFGLLLAQAYYKGTDAAHFVPLPVSIVDDTNVTVSGGGSAAGASVRVALLYSTVPPGW